MPILEVTTVGESTAPDRKGRSTRIAEAAGAVFRSGPGSTWVLLREVAAGDYAENAAAPGDQHSPVFVGVLQKNSPPRPELEIEPAALTRAVAEACGRDPAQVHVIYEPPAGGRVAFGGRLVE